MTTTNKNLSLLVLAATVLAVAATPSDAVAETKPAPPSASARIEVDRVVAVVGDQWLFTSELDVRMKPLAPRIAEIKDPKERAATLAQVRQDIVRMMVDEALVGIECRRLKIDVVDAEVEQATAAVAKRNGMTDAQLAAEIEKQHMTREEYAAEVRRQIYTGKWMQAVVAPRVERKLLADPQLAEPALEAKRREMLDELRRRTYVQVRP